MTNKHPSSELDAHELRLIITTLDKRRAWLHKALKANELEGDAKQEALNALKLLDSSLQKLTRQGAEYSRPPDSAKPELTMPRKAFKRPAIEPANAYVLIAEDSRDSALLLKGILEDLGIQHIDLVEDGRAALYALQNCSPPYDIVLCDWDMPEMSGLEVRRSVRNLAKLRDTHFIMVTATSEVSRIREAIQLGVNDYLVKPINLQTLERKVLKALAEQLPGDKDTVPAIKPSNRQDAQ